MSSTRTRNAAACLILLLGVAGCDDATAVMPAPSQLPTSAQLPAPTPPQPQPTASILRDATLSGRVYEVVTDSPRTIAGIEGAWVYCEQCGESTHNWALTDAKGDYVFPKGVWDETRPSFPIRISVSKDGYGEPAGTPRPTPPNPSGPGWREVVINGDTRFEIELVRR